MSIARGIAKAAKAQSRGLSGKRNSQGDFMTGENQLDTDRFAASEMRARDNMSETKQELSYLDSMTNASDAQLLINDAKKQLDSLDSQIADMEKWLDDNPKAQEWDINDRHHSELNMKKQEVLLDLEAELESLGVEVPQEVKSMIDPDIKKYYESGGDPEFGNDMANAELY